MSIATEELIVSEQIYSRQCPTSDWRRCPHLQEHFEEEAIYCQSRFFQLYPGRIEEAASVIKDFWGLCLELENEKARVYTLPTRHELTVFEHLLEDSGIKFPENLVKAVQRTHQEDNKRLASIIISPRSEIR